MSTGTVILACSLAANAACAWLVLRASVLPAERGPAVPRPVALRPELAPPPPVTSPGALPLEQQRDRLLALGLPRADVNRALRALMEEKRLARQRAFYAEAAKQPWWRGGVVHQNITPDQHRELRELRKAERAEIARVLGADALVDEAAAQRYDFLSPDKAARLAALEHDYAELRREPADDTADPQERQRLLTTEYERDLAALLTPDERVRLQERESATARTLGYRLEFFRTTDDEYRALFAAQKAFDERTSRAPGAPASPDVARSRMDAMRQFEQDLKAALGPRFEEYLLSQRSEYRALTALQRRYDVPQVAIDHIARLQLETSAEANRIADDASMPRPQKKAALEELVARARAGIRTTFAPAVADAYLSATDAAWLRRLEQGHVTRSQITGGFSTRSVLADPPKPASPAPPKT